MAPLNFTLGVLTKNHSNMNEVTKPDKSMIVFLGCTALLIALPVCVGLLVYGTVTEIAASASGRLLGLAGIAALIYFSVVRLTPGATKFTRRFSVIAVVLASLHLALLAAFNTDTSHLLRQIGIVRIHEVTTESPGSADYSKAAEYVLRHP